jgi:hypothetical protein
VPVGIKKRISVQVGLDINEKPYSKLPKKHKEQGAWLKWQSTCLARQALSSNSSIIKKREEVRSLGVCS